TVFVFAKDIQGWTTDSYGQPIEFKSAVATTISHESGHAFGLRHQRTFNADGSVNQEYDPGSGGWTPIMGNNLSPNRTTWSFAQTDVQHISISLPFGGSFSFNIPIYQDELATISGSQNGFGYRADDHGNTLATADSLTKATIFSTRATGKGIIETT